MGMGSATGGGAKGTGYLDPLGISNNPSMDPLNLFAPNQPGGANYAQSHPQLPNFLQALNGQPTGSVLGLNGPQLPDPTLWGARTPTGGMFNQMAQQTAGPVYQGGLQIPGVSPGMLNQPIPQGGMMQAGQGGGSKGAVPQASPWLNKAFGNPGGLPRGFMLQ